jgi:hypothetical protein
MTIAVHRPRALYNVKSTVHSIHSQTGAVTNVQKMAFPSMHAPSSPCYYISPMPLPVIVIFVHTYCSELWHGFQRSCSSGARSNSRTARQLIPVFKQYRPSLRLPGTGFGIVKVRTEGSSVYGRPYGVESLVRSRMVYAAFLHHMQALPPGNFHLALISSAFRN